MLSFMTRLPQCHSFLDASFAPFDQRAELAVGDLRIHPARVADKGRETAIGAGEHPLASDDVGELADALRHQFRVLDVVGAGVDHAGDQHLVVRQFGIAPHRPFMGMPRVGGLERDRLRLSLQDDRQDLLQWNVEVVRALVVAPAQMQPRRTGRHIRQRVVERLDLLFGLLEEFRFGQILEAGVARHREVGAVELHHDAGAGDGLVFLPHGIGDGADIGGVGRIVAIGLERGDHARGGRRHERIGRLRRRDRRLEVGNVLLHRVVVADLDVTDAAQPAEHHRADELHHALAEIGIIRHVAIRFRRERLAAETGEALLDVGRVADLAGLAVTDDIDADRHLVRDDLAHRLRDLAIEIGMIVGLVLILLHQQIDQRLRPRQAADMGRQDAIRAELHGFLPGLLRRWYKQFRSGASLGWSDGFRCALPILRRPRHLA